MSRRVRSNPDWSDVIAHKNCDAIRATCREFKLPLPILDSQCNIKDELGAGAYGAVYSTTDPKMILKITSDPTESHFVALSLALKQKEGIDPKGIVNYAAIFALDQKHDGRPTFVIWRESAKSIGLRARESSSCEIKEFEDQLSRYYTHAEKAFWIADEAARSMPVNEYWAWLKADVDAANAILDGKKWDIPIFVPEFARSLAKAYMVAEEMESNNTRSMLIGHALKTWLRSGCVICDLHANNVGEIERGRCGGKVWCVTDPGHVLILRRKYSDIEIPTIMESR